MSDVSVVGLGSMGSALASALLARGHSVTVWNRSSGKAAPLVQRGAVEAASYVNLVETSRDQGIGTGLIEPMGELMRNGVAAGYGKADLGSLVELIGRPET